MVQPGSAYKFHECGPASEQNCAGRHAGENQLPGSEPDLLTLAIVVRNGAIGEKALQVERR
jgi:hypothetical protein